METGRKADWLIWGRAEAGGGGVKGDPASKWETGFRTLGRGRGDATAGLTLCIVRCSVSSDCGGKPTKTSPKPKHSLIVTAAYT